MKKLSVIIVVYRSESVIFDCLNSINQFNDLGKDLEVVVVDNERGSSLGDKLNMEYYSFDGHYILANGNKGFGAGNNIGALVSGAEVLFFLNPDTILIENLFKDVYEAIHKDPKVVYGFSLVDKDGNTNNSYSFFYDSFIKYRLLSLCKQVAYKWPLRNKWAVRHVWPWGAAFAMSKAAYEKAGRFDESIFLCNEEPDLLKRMPERKVFISNRQIVHLEGHGTTVSENRYYYAFKSFAYYQDKYAMSSFNKWLWDSHVKMLCMFKTLFAKDESSVNYVKAYRHFKEEKQ